MKTIDITVAKILAAYKRKGYVLKDTTDIYSNSFAINIGGIRTLDNTSGKYSDFLFIIRKSVRPATCTINDAFHTRKYEDDYVLDIFAATTKPGIPNLLKPVNPKGTAIIVPGQYIDVWVKGLHKGQYEALVQCGTFKITRDNDKDSVVDYDGVQTLSTGDGINCHHGSKTPAIFIGLYSAGCQVHKDTAKFESVFMWTVDNAIDKGMKKFTYTLFEEKDIV